MSDEEEAVKDTEREREEIHRRDHFPMIPQANRILARDSHEMIYTNPA
jgi:hypothetical protein